MVIGIVVNVLEEEHERERQLDPDEVTLKDLKLEIAELKELLEKQRG